MFVSSPLRLLAAVAALACSAALPAHAAGAKPGVFRPALGGVLTPVTGHHVGLNALPDVVVNVAGISSNDDFGAPGNTILAFDATPGATVDLITWNLTLSTIGASYLSEAGVLITNSAGDGVYFDPGYGDDFSGTGTYADGGSLVALGISFDVLGDGKLYFEFYEEYDDNPSAADALYSAGTITLAGVGVSAVPEPGTYGLMALGALAVVGAARRRKAA